MRLVEQHIIKSNNVYYKDLKELCRKSKNLYNTTLYYIRQHFFETKSYLPYVQIDKRYLKILIMLIIDLYHLKQHNKQ